MTLDFVIDVGNSRIKCGIVDAFKIKRVLTLSISPDDWPFQLSIDATKQQQWAISGVNPRVIHDFEGWLTRHRQMVIQVNHHTMIPIACDVLTPERVGLDRLLGAYAARQMYPTDPIITVDAGTATTINYVNDAGAFAGGYILPGMKLLAEVLTQRTAQLPEIDLRLKQKQSPFTFPGKNTEEAMRGGIYAATIGAIREAMQAVTAKSTKPLKLVVTGGNVDLLLDSLASFQPDHQPNLVLDGLLYAVTSKP